MKKILIASSMLAASLILSGCQSDEKKLEKEITDELTNQQKNTTNTDEAEASSEETLSTEPKISISNQISSIYVNKKNNHTIVDYNIEISNASDKPILLNDLEAIVKDTNGNILKNDDTIKAKPGFIDKNKSTFLHAKIDVGELDENVVPDINTIELKTPYISFSNLKIEHLKINFGSLNQNDDLTYTLEGEVTNLSEEELEEVHVYGSLYDAFGVFVATFYQSLGPMEARGVRDFTLKTSAVYGGSPAVHADLFSSSLFYGTEVE